MQSVGIEIGSRSVRVARVSFAGSPPVLDRFDEVEFNPGAVRHGEIIDPDVVAKAVAKAFSKGGKAKAVSIGIANDKVVARTVELPWMQSDELKGAIQYQVQEFIPMPVESAVIDYDILDEFTNDAGEKMLRLLVVAAQKDMVETFVEVLKKAGVHPEAIDFAPLALIRSAGVDIDAVRSSGASAEMLVDVGAGVTSVVVHHLGTPKLVRVLATGGDAVTEALASAMSVEFEQAEQLKRAGSEDPAVYRTPVAAEVLEQQVGSLVEQVQGSLDYYQALPAAVAVSKIVISGGGSHLEQFGRRLGDATGLPVQAVAGLGVSMSDKVGRTAADEAEMAAAVGVALGALAA